jgi:uncharacterized protein (TIGR03000 family)
MLVNPPTSRSSDTDVTLIVRTTPDAVVWINGSKTTQTGPRREFVSAGPEPGRIYTFQVRAQWTGSDGQSVEATRPISVVAGEKRVVDFTKNGISSD